MRRRQTEERSYSDREEREKSSSDQDDDVDVNLWHLFQQKGDLETGFTPRKWICSEKNKNI